jgi:hypothetical protein
MFAIVENIEGTTLEGLLKGTIYWMRYNKFAIISEKNWLKVSAKVLHALPGIKVKYFKKSQVDEAWAWIRE